MRPALSAIINQSVAFGKRKHTFEPWKRVRLVAGCVELERMVGCRLAGMARMLQLQPAQSDRAA